MKTFDISALTGILTKIVLLNITFSIVVFPDLYVSLTSPNGIALSQNSSIIAPLFSIVSLFSLTITVTVKSFNLEFAAIPDQITVV
jgi:hypothetical protein